MLSYAATVSVFEFSSTASAFRNELILDTMEWEWIWISDWDISVINSYFSYSELTRLFDQSIKMAPTPVCPVVCLSLWRTNREHFYVFQWSEKPADAFQHESVVQSPRNLFHRSLLSSRLMVVSRPVMSSSQNAVLKLKNQRLLPGLLWIRWSLTPPLP